MNAQEARERSEAARILRRQRDAERIEREKAERRALIEKITSETIKALEWKILSACDEGQFYYVDADIPATECGGDAAQLVIEHFKGLGYKAGYRKTSTADRDPDHGTTTFYSYTVTVKW